MDPAEIEAKIRLIPYNVDTTNWQAAEKLMRLVADDTKRIGTEIGAKEKTTLNVRSKVKKIGLLPGMTPVVPTSSNSVPSSSSSSASPPHRNNLLVPRSEENQVLHSAPIERGAGGIEEVSPDRRGTQGTEGMTEERSSPQKERLSPQKEQLRNILQTRRRKNSLRKEGDSSEGMRNSSVPQTGSSDSSQSSSGGT